MQAHPEELRQVAESIALIASAKVHAVHPEGKLVVTLETTDSPAILACIERMRSLPGVLTALLVYQHSESLEAMNEEVSDEAHTPGIH